MCNLTDFSQSLMPRWWLCVLVASSLGSCVSQGREPATHAAKSAKPAAASPKADVLPQSLSLAQARRIAFQRNWDLLAAQANVELAVAQELVSREFPNPTFSYTTGKISTDSSPNGTRHGNGIWDRSYDSVFAVNQLFEIGGKRSQRQSSATHGRQAAQASLEDARRILDLSLCSIGLFGCHADTDPAAKQHAENLPAAKVQGDTITFPTGSPQQDSLLIETAQPVGKSVVRVNGHLGWYEEATVRVFASVAGRVDRICVQIGQQVQAGDPLALIASPDFGQAQADASRAAADEKLAARTLTRLRDLLAHGAVAQKDVEAGEDDYAAKTSENQRAQARLRLYGVTVGSVDGHYPLKSPVGGTVVDKTINPGQEVRPDQMLANAPQLFAPLFIVSDPRQLAVQLDITELETGSLKPGQVLYVRSRAYPDMTFDGRLELIGDSLDPLTRMVKARGIVDNKLGLLRSEMYVAVEVEADGDGVVRSGAAADHGANLTGHVEVPSGAVFSKDDKHCIYVEKAPGTYQSRVVEIGREHDGKITVTGNLAANERIVSEGCLLLQAMTETAKE